MTPLGIKPATSRLVEQCLNQLSYPVSLQLNNVSYFPRIFFVALRPNAGHGLLILEVSRSHTQRRTTVGRTPLDE
jgi:hypothetical protein